MKLVVWKMDIAGHLITLCVCLLGVGVCNFVTTARNARNFEFLIGVPSYAEVILNK